MASRADLLLLRDALNVLSAAARRDLDNLLAGVDLGPGPALWAELGPLWIDLLGSYGEAAAALGADMFERWADDLDLQPSTKLVRPVDGERALNRLGWALSTADVAGNLAVLTDELVKQPARSTIQSSAVASGGGWARVPQGVTCRWCLMLASRGGVYSEKSAAQARSGRKYHGDCDCQPVLVRSAGDYPPGYDPDDLADRYRRGEFDSKSH